jgi:hypothetical protein
MKTFKNIYFLATFIFVFSTFPLLAQQQNNKGDDSSEIPPGLLDEILSSATKKAANDAGGTDAEKKENEKTMQDILKQVGTDTGSTSQAKTSTDKKDDTSATKKENNPFAISGLPGLENNKKPVTTTSKPTGQSKSSASQPKVTSSVKKTPVKLADEKKPKTVAKKTSKKSTRDPYLAPRAKGASKKMPFRMPGTDSPRAYKPEDVIFKQYGDDADGIYRYDLNRNQLADEDKDKEKVTTAKVIAGVQNPYDSFADKEVVVVTKDEPGLIKEYPVRKPVDSKTYIIKEDEPSKDYKEVKYDNFYLD